MTRGDGDGLGEIFGSWSFGVFGFTGSGDGTGVDGMVG